MYIVDYKTVKEEDYSFLGGKAASFAKLKDYMLPIPEWIVLKNNAFFDSLSEKQKKMYQDGNWTEFKESIKGFHLKDSVQKELEDRIALVPADYFAVRSSALSEDSGGMSFAGQFETYLWRTKEQLGGAVVQCFLSGFSERVAYYRQQNNLEGMPEVPSVIIQKMVKSECAGVAFAVNPQNADITTSVVSAVYGLGSALVDGEANADTYYVEKGKKITDKKIASKNVCHVVSQSHVVTRKVQDKKKNLPVLTEQQILKVARLARKTSRIFSQYQDIEWAFEKGKLYLLQSRPITSLGKVVPIKERCSIFDNSNIAESYNGVTLPLTFSFISYAYEGVYRELCKTFGVSDKILKKNFRVFKNMIAIRNGRVYYNLRSWYKMMSILPGYKFNKEFMEQMMGVKEKLPEEFTISEEEGASGFEKIWERVCFIKTFLCFYGQYFTLEKNMKKFYKMNDKAVSHRNMEYLTINELYERFYKIRFFVVEQWKAPLVNDFLTMIFHGMLKKVCEKWIKEDGIHNDLLCGQGGIISAKPAHMIGEMGRITADDTEMVQTFLTGTIGEIEYALHKRKKLYSMVRQYLKLFGDRCLDELKLESDSVRDNPLLLYRTIGETARHRKCAADNLSDEIGEAARKKARKKLKGYPLRRLIFYCVYKNASRFVKNRENMRFERTRMFGYVRNLINQMGMRLASTQDLDDAKDIYYLDMETILGFIDGTSAVYDLKKIVASRKEEYKNYRNKIEKPRFTIYGKFGNALKAKKQDRSCVEQKEAEIMKGISCSPGIVEGKARVIFDCRNAVMKDGEILVANHTDPGWIMLFNQASAVVVECGSLLSHAAIVSREMGIPSVVSVSNVSERIHTGDRIRVDGSLGTVEILERGNRNEE